MLPRMIARIMAALLLAASPLAAHAQGWPEREITLTVMYGAGGNTDLMTRLIARHLSAKLGKPVQVANRPGAMGTLGPDFLSRQKPDGYQIGIVTSSTIALAPHLVAVRFTLDDFEYAGAFGYPRFGIAVRADSPFLTLGDLVRAGKPEKSVFFGAGGALNALIADDLNQAAGAKFDIVNYKSGVETVTALVGGQVQAIVQNPSDILPYVEAGRLRLLAAVGSARWPQLPAVPTVKELGYEGGPTESWTAIGLPRGTPAAIVARLEKEILEISRDESFRQAMSQLGNEMLSATGKEFETMVRRQHAQWGVSLKKSGLAQGKD